MKRDAAGRSLDRLVLGSIVVGVAVGLYAGWLAAIAAVAVYIVVLIVGTRLWLIYKVSGALADSNERLKKSERGEPLEAEPLWTRYSGKANTAALLREKAAIVAELIAMCLDRGEALASVLSARFGERDKCLAKAETSAYWLYIVDRSAFRLLSTSERDIFMGALKNHMIEKLSAIGMDRSEFLNLLQARYVEYATYKKWVAKDGESAKGTLNWEFAKKVATILKVGTNALFNTQLSIMMLRHLNRMELAPLLTGNAIGGLGSDF